MAPDALFRWEQDMPGEEGERLKKRNSHVRYATAVRFSLYEREAELARCCNDNDR